MKLGLGAKIEHPEYGEGVIFGWTEEHYRIYFRDHGEKVFSKLFDKFELLEEPTFEDKTISLEDVVAAVQNVFDQQQEISEIIELADKWEGGTMIMHPADEDLKSKEIPLDAFFHKIVMVRDRLRVMEQRINSNKKMSDQEKVELQQYITRIYGSLTTFNILFKNKKDNFVGASSRGEG